MKQAIRSFELEGPAGRLEAILNTGSPAAPIAAVVCHPHPLFGGTLHNKVVYRAMKALNDPAHGLGFPVLRFNFRGVGRSQGTHDGHLEADDVLAAIDWLAREFHLPILVAGFSFGAAMAIRASALVTESHASSHHARTCGLIALGLPTITDYAADRYASLQRLPVPKLFLSGDHDRFSSPADLQSIVDSAAEPKRLLFFPGADHFFTHHLEPMQHAIAGWSKETLL